MTTSTKILPHQNCQNKIIANTIISEKNNKILSTFHSLAKTTTVCIKTAVTAIKPDDLDKKKIANVVSCKFVAIFVNIMLRFPQFNWQFNVKSDKWTIYSSSSSSSATLLIHQFPLAD